jgi:hypothetical protein
VSPIIDMLPKECHHGVHFDKEAAEALLRNAPKRKVDPALAFILGSTASNEIRKRWPRGWFDADHPCPLGCGYVGIAYASYEHYIMGDW